MFSITWPHSPPLLTVQPHCDISVIRPLLMPPLPFVLLQALLLYLANSYSSYGIYPKFLLPLPKFSPVPLVEWAASCTTPTSLNHCLCLSWFLWEYDWGKHLCFCYPAHSFHPATGSSTLKFPLGHYPIPALSPLLDSLFQITLDSGMAIRPNLGYCPSVPGLLFTPLEGEKLSWLDLNRRVWSCWIITAALNEPVQ